MMNIVSQTALAFCISACLGSAIASPFSSREEERRGQVWSLLRDKKITDIKCNGISNCDSLVRAFISKSGVDFMLPEVRATSAADPALARKLPACLRNTPNTFLIPDGIKFAHVDRATGPVVVFKLEGAAVRASRPILWIEYYGLKRLDPPKGRMEPFIGVRIADIVSCTITRELWDNEEGLIDDGFFLFGEKLYRYVVGKPPGFDYYFSILTPDEPQSGLVGPGVYLELH
jgi:hypothetical protein